MKKTILILSLIILVGCKSKKTNQQLDKNTTLEQTDENNEETLAEKLEKKDLFKLGITEVDNFKRARAYEMGTRILMTCNTSKFKPFTSNEATASVIKNITLEKLSATCSKYRQWYGTFIELKLVEIYKDTSKNTLVFRYKALYSKKVANKELRVFMNDENKVSAIKTLDWKNDFMP